MQSDAGGTNNVFQRALPNHYCCAPPGRHGTQLLCVWLLLLAEAGSGSPF